METFSALLALCVGNSPVTGEFPSQRPVTRSFGVFFDLRPNEPLSKQSWGWWLETPSLSLRHHYVLIPRTPFWYHTLWNKSKETCIVLTWLIHWGKLTHLWICENISSSIEWKACCGGKSLLEPMMIYLWNLHFKIWSFPCCQMLNISIKVPMSDEPAHKMNWLITEFGFKVTDKSNNDLNCAACSQARY